MSQLLFSMFGAPIIKADGEAIKFRRRKSMALLAYLALTTEMHRRESLAAMFWPEFDDESARRGLRQVLWEISGTPLRPFLQIDRENVALANETDELWIDVRRFRHLLALCQSHQHAPTTDCQECLANLIEAADLYRGDFLRGFSLRDAGAKFDEWQFLQTENLRDNAAQTLTQLVSIHEAEGDYDSAIARAQQLLTLDSTNETAYRQLMQFYAATNQPAATLRTYQLCVKTLQHELGEPPQIETSRLHEEIKNGKFSVSDLNKNRIGSNDSTSTLLVRGSLAHINDQSSNSLEKLAHPPQLAWQTTPFLGRERELNEIFARLENSECRLLTLVGTGGIGKTRLALQAAQQFGKIFRDGVHFVSLTAVNSPDMLVPAIADALLLLGGEIRGQLETKSQLIDYLQNKRLLLALDSFDHLLAGAEILTEILEHAAEIKFLVTSRERLHLRAEWLFELEGLPFPADESAEDLENYSAVQLFLQTAEKVETKFISSRTARESIARICRIVGGLPLGIELAASWVHALSCQQIAREIERSLDLLTTTLRDVPREHQSIRAVFERSWQFLSERERRALRMMSVFRGGFRLDAAQFVADAELLTLSILMDKSLLRRATAERYEMHELIRQFAAEKLCELPDEKRLAHNLHCAYYSQRFVADAEVEIEERREVWEEIENARAGWEWAIEHEKVAEIERYLNSIFRLYDLRGWVQEGAVGFAKAANSVRQIWQADPNALHQVLLGKLMVRQGIFAVLMGQNEKAFQLLSDGLQLFGEAELPEERAQCLKRLGIVIYHLGDYRTAKSYLEQSLALYRELKDQRGVAQNLNRLAYLAGEIKDYPEAERLLEESLQINRTSNRKKDITDSLNDLGYALYLVGKYERAAKLLEESLVLSKEIGYRRAVASTLDNLGCVATACDKIDEARQYFQEALKISLEIRAVPIALDVLAGTVALLVRENGREEQAIKVLNFIINHSATWKVTRETAQNLLLAFESNKSLNCSNGADVSPSAEHLEIDDVIAQLA